MNRVMLFMGIAAMLVACGGAESKKSDDGDTTLEDVRVIVKSVKKPAAPVRQNWRGPALYGDVQSVKTTTRYGDEYAERFYGGDNMSRIVMWEFDENGDAIAYTSYDADVQPTRSLLAVEPHYTPEEESVADNLRYEYDAAGNRIKTSILGRDDMVMSEIIYTYDKHGNLIEQATYSLGRYPRTLTTKFTMSYDEYGNIIEYKELCVATNLVRSIRTYEITYRN